MVDFEETDIFTQFGADGLPVETQDNPINVANKKLFCALVIRMWRDATKDNISEFNRTAAVYWFFADHWDDEYIPSFLWICSLFGWPPQKTREAILINRSLDTVAKKMGF